MGNINFNTEQKILGCILVMENQGILECIKRGITTDDFNDIHHQKLFKVMKWLDDKKELVTFENIANLYKKHNKETDRDLCIDLEYWLDIVDLIPSRKFLNSYIEEFIMTNNNIADYNFVVQNSNKSLTL
jgi:replicative DNA helicase